jgi:hypothetical protein
MILAPSEKWIARASAPVAAIAARFFGVVRRAFGGRVLHDVHRAVG